MASFYVQFWSARPQGKPIPLIGGKFNYESSRFETRKQAEAIMDATVESNGGPRFCGATIHESNRPPEIAADGGPYRRPADIRTVQDGPLKGCVVQIVRRSKSTNRLTVRIVTSTVPAYKPGDELQLPPHEVNARDTVTK